MQYKGAHLLVGLLIVVAIVILTVSSLAKKTIKYPPNANPNKTIYYICDSSINTCKSTATPPSGAYKYLHKSDCQKACQTQGCSFTPDSGYSGHCTPNTTKADLTTTCSGTKNSGGLDTNCATYKDNPFRGCDVNGNVVYCPYKKSGCSTHKNITCKPYWCCDGDQKKKQYRPSSDTGSLPAHCSDSESLTCTTPYNPESMVYYGSTSKGNCSIVVTPNGPPQGFSPNIVVGCKDHTNNVVRAEYGIEGMYLLSTDPSLIHDSTPYCVFTVKDDSSGNVLTNHILNDKGKSQNITWSPASPSFGCNGDPFLNSGWCPSDGTSSGCNGKCVDPQCFGTCKPATFVKQCPVFNQTTQGQPFETPNKCGENTCSYGYISDETTGGWGQCLPTHPKCACTTVSESESSSQTCPCGQVAVGNYCMTPCPTNMDCRNKVAKLCSTYSTSQTLGGSDASACMQSYTNGAPGDYQCMCKPRITGSGCEPGNFYDAVDSDGHLCTSTGCLGCTLTNTNTSQMRCALPDPNTNYPSAYICQNNLCKRQFNSDENDIKVCEHDGQLCVIGDGFKDSAIQNALNKNSSYKDCMENHMAVCVSDPTKKCVPVSQYYGPHVGKSASCQYYNSFLPWFEKMETEKDYTPLQYFCGAFSQQ